MNKRWVVLFFLAFSIAVPQCVFAANIDELLLDRLVSKGVVTQDEAAEIRAETAIKTQEELSQKKKFSLEGNTKISLGGYLQAQFLADQTAGACDEYKIRRARLDFRGEPAKNIGWRLQMDAVQPLKVVISSVSQNGTIKTKAVNAVSRPVLLDANIDYNLYSFANIRIGQFYVPFGMENTTSDSFMDIINRSQVTEKLVPGRDIGAQGRDIGLQVSGDTNFGKENKILGYMIGVFNGAGMNLDDDNEYKDFAGRILVFPIKGLSVGLSGYNGKYGTTNVDKLRAGAEATYTLEGMSLKAEYVSGKDGAMEKYGWYAQAGYKFIPTVETILKYDSYDPDTNTSGDKNDILTLGLNWFISKNAKIQVNYEWKNEELTQADNNGLIAQFQIMY